MTKYHVTGMSCAACSARVEKAVNGVEGVTSCSVSLLTNSMGVEGTADSQAIIQAVVKAGYGASVDNGKQTASTPQQDEFSETKKLRNRLLLSLGFLLVLMYFSMGHMMFHFPLPSFFVGNPIAIGLVELLLTICVMIINRKFFISGCKGLIHRSPNMDTLVALGSGAAFVYSLVALFGMTDAQVKGDSEQVTQYMNAFYFESSAMILTLITVGKMLESYAKGKTTNALKGLMELAPKTAILIRDGKEVTVPIEEVQQGDIFVVKPGGAIPVDGIVLEGESAVDESAITGESIPVDKVVGNAVTSATMNRSGFLKCRATQVGEDTTLSKIIRMVSDAAATKAPIAKIADKVSGIFVPTVITLAVITFIVWLCINQQIGYALARGISVLVISCPCALGLATPVAIMVGNGVGAKNGILFKTAISLEQTGKVQIVALDKTGTITEGKPQVTDLSPDDGISKQELLQAALIVECHSEHPLAKAILQYGQENHISYEEPEHFQNLLGNGVKAEYHGDTYLGGSGKFMERLLSPALQKQGEILADAGKTPLYFAKNNTILGCIAVSDVLKADASQAIAELKKQGIFTVMLSGDNPRTAQAIAQQAGVDRVIAGVKPDGKEDVIRQLQQYGTVAMVGDGINDAPALTRADSGIAIGAGTDIAIDAADVVLMKSNALDIPAAIRLSRATVRNIHENLFWAFIYNIIGIPLAAGVWIPLFGWELNPMFGAAAMSLSSFCVVSNALRLNLFALHKSHRDKPLKHAVNPKDIQIQTTSEGKEMTQTIQVKGMMCPHCEAAVKRALEKLDAVTTATADHKSGTVEMQVTEMVDTSVLRGIIEDAGYEFVG